MDKCKCGCTTFLVDEAILHKADIFNDGDGKLEVHKVYGSEITSIKCKNCDKEYREDEFKAIEFC
jgi:predicted nucleic-acid-binding Zn-ribbon protein